MPLGEGWWLHPTGRAVAVFEHLDTVLGDPRAFGLDRAAVRRRPGELDDAHRARVLRAAMRRGWIRVRTHRADTVFECWRLGRAARRAIDRFTAAVLRPGPASRVRIHALGPARGRASARGGERARRRGRARVRSR